MKRDNSVSHSLGELTKDSNDRDPFRRKQQTAITGGIEDRTLKADIPDGIVAFMKLNAGNKILWELDIIKGERVAILRKKVK